MENLLILTGPTGIGKTELSLKIAEIYNCQIISADSMQIYKGMDIGTAKIDLKNTTTKHYMIDIVEPNVNYSVADFKKETVKLITRINKLEKLPFIVGGTGLYINSITNDLSFQNVTKNNEYRMYLEKLIKEKGLDYLYKILQEKNKDISLKINKNNKNRIIRALEILEFSKKIEVDQFRQENKRYNLLYLGLNMDRKELYNNINSRVDLMIEKGLVEEVKGLLEKYNSDELTSFKAIGYKEIVAYIKGYISLYESIDLIKKNSRHYAKRQLTWFRRDNRIIWFDKNDLELENKIYRTIGEKFARIK